MTYKKNDIITVTVTAIENYGVFVLTDNKTTGLIHISEIDYKFITNINDFVNLEEQIYCEIIDFDKKKLVLSIKNIDYRNTGKRKKSPKEEFSLLKENLGSWVETKLKEIEN